MARKPTLRKPSPPRTPVVHLSACANAYLRAVADPFNDNNPPACVPDSKTLPSFKQRLYSRGVFASGTTGIGRILVGAYAPSSNGACADMSTNTSVQTWTTTFDTVTNTQVATWNDARDTTAEIDNDDTAYRPVAIALRIKYNGPREYSAGVIHPLSNANNLHLGGESMSTSAKNMSGAVTAVGLGWHTTVWRPKNAADDSYRDDVLTAKPFGFGIEGTYTGAGVVGAATFMYELVGYYELVGGTNLGATPSESDVTGFAAVQSATSGLVGAPTLDKAWTDVKSALLTGASYAIENPGKTMTLARQAKIAFDGLRGRGHHNIRLT